MTPEQQQLENVSVAAKFANLTSEQFSEQIDKRMAAQKQLTDAVKDVVDEGTLTPIDGLALSSCISGRLFGYEEFHGPEAQTWRETIARNALNSPQTQRQPVGAH